MQVSPECLSVYSQITPCVTLDATTLWLKGFAYQFETSKDNWNAYRNNSTLKVEMPILNLCALLALKRISTRIVLNEKNQNVRSKIRKCKTILNYSFTFKMHDSMASWLTTLSCLQQTTHRCAKYWKKHLFQHTAYCRTFSPLSLPWNFDKRWWLCNEYEKWSRKSETVNTILCVSFIYRLEFLSLVLVQRSSVFIHDASNVLDKKERRKTIHLRFCDYLLKLPVTILMRKIQLYCIKHFNLKSDRNAWLCLCTWILEQTKPIKYQHSRNQQIIQQYFCKCIENLLLLKSMRIVDWSVAVVIGRI